MAEWESNIGRAEILARVIDTKTTRKFIKEILLVGRWSFATDGKGFVAVKDLALGAVPDEGVRGVMTEHLSAKPSGRVDLFSLRKEIEPPACGACQQTGWLEIDCHCCSDFAHLHKFDVECPCSKDYEGVARCFGEAFNTRLLWLLLRDLTGLTAGVVPPCTGDKKKPLVLTTKAWRVGLMPLHVSAAEGVTKELKTKVRQRAHA